MFVCSTYEAKNQIRNTEGYRFLNPQSSDTAQIETSYSGSLKPDALQYVAVCQDKNCISVKNSCIF